MNLQKGFVELRRSISVQTAAVEYPRERSRIEVWRAQVPLALRIDGPACGELGDHGMKSPTAVVEISSLLQMLDTLKPAHN